MDASFDVFLAYLAMGLFFSIGAFERSVERGFNLLDWGVIVLLSQQLDGFLLPLRAARVFLLQPP